MPMSRLVLPDDERYLAATRSTPKPFVADLTLGAVATYGRWRFAATHTRRSREFEGQREAPVFGTFAISRSF